MTLHEMASIAIRRTMRGECMTTERAFRDPRIAAWLVWSMRGTDLARTKSEDYNRARRVLQRAGIKRV